MAETVLALPFLMLILLFIAYFGRNSVRIERTHMMDRYEAWREAGSGTGPSPDDPRGHPQMNDTWFNNTATAITHVSTGDFPDDAPEQWIDEASQRTNEAGELARKMWETMARGKTSQFSTRHDTSNILLEQFNGPVNAQHTVQGHDWKFINGYKHRAEEYEPDQKKGPYAHNLNPLRDLFYEAFDRTLEGMSDNQNPLAKTMRGLYLDIPGYRGPKVQ
jgi:hypothetical protein